MKRFWLLFLLIASCGPLQRSSPFSEHTNSKSDHLNDRAINGLQRLDQTPQDIVLVAIADSHQNYDDLTTVVSSANQQQADFVVHLGDFTNQGYNFEYDLFINRMKKLNLPFVVALGNHDTVTKGKSLYLRLFGDFNRMFEFRGYRFIILNNNNLDFKAHGGVDWDWLRRNVEASLLPIVLMYHINPDNTDYFTDSDRQTFDSIVIGSRVRLMLHGHHHVFATSFANGILKHMVHRTEEAKWSRITLRANEISIDYCQKLECVRETTQAFP
ncbi:metallophosphoesterase [Bdellovibrio sp. 22V]|uniref:metallophosphoesterase family protein n=1 Tax=Bdellovibrio TaxID=958 RepID=UPI002543A40E|nr:metallophosphoesterase [Bdellovibrio sp. 22V]WII72003.1 metallophosphoesterase [Bdellovibrio sp. 22V]